MSSNSSSNQVEASPSENIIKGKIWIDDVNKYYQIINSFENFRIKDKRSEDFLILHNDKEIKDNVKIKIDGDNIDFVYQHKFSKVGEHEIEYSIGKNLTKINHLFSDCESITSLDLSNFNTKNIINMKMMFNNCISLKNLNLSNFNTENVTDMSEMFFNCKSLEDLDLSNFNNKMVTNMSCMFYGCESLKNLNLSKFKTEKVSNMDSMFKFCKSIETLNLSSFKTQNAIFMN